MKKLSVLLATLLAAGTFSAIAADKPIIAKAPTLMTDAQMKQVVGAGSPGFGICTAVGFANASGATKNFGPNPTSNVNSNGSPATGYAPGFGLHTAKGVTLGCTFVFS